MCALLSLVLGGAASATTLTTSVDAGPLVMVEPGTTVPRLGMDPYLLAWGAGVAAGPSLSLSGTGAAQLTLQAVANTAAISITELDGHLVTWLADTGLRAAIAFPLGRSTTLSWDVQRTVLRVAPGDSGPDLSLGPQPDNRVQVLLSFSPTR